MAKKNSLESKEKKISLNEYLAENSRMRNLDGTISKWYRRQYKTTSPKTKSEWDAIVSKFFNEVE